MSFAPSTARLHTFIIIARQTHTSYINNNKCTKRTVLTHTHMKAKMRKNGKQKKDPKNHTMRFMFVN